MRGINRINRMLEIPKDSLKINGKVESLDIERQIE